MHGETASYYAAKVAAHGPTPYGVDWACEPTQQLRFVQLLKLCDFTAPFSINDLGCGYAALLDFIDERWPEASVDYHGIDLVPEMIDHARRLHPAREHASFDVGSSCGQRADYCVASGIFNVKLDDGDGAWEAMVCDTLADMHRHCSRGFAANFLRRLDVPNPVKELYRTTPAPWRTFCAARLGIERVEVLENYGMREFTVLAWKRP